MIRQRVWFRLVDINRGKSLINALVSVFRKIRPFTSKFIVIRTLKSNKHSPISLNYQARADAKGRPKNNFLDSNIGSGRPCNSSRVDDVRIGWKTRRENLH